MSEETKSYFDTMAENTVRELRMMGDDFEGAKKAALYRLTRAYEHGVDAGRIRELDRRIAERDEQIAAARQRIEQMERDAGKILGSPTNHVGMHVPSQDALVGLEYADALIAATTPESEAK